MKTHTMKFLSLCRRISDVMHGLASLPIQLETIRRELLKVRGDVDELRMLMGSQGVCRVTKDKELTELHEAELKVFSQWGDDGIVQYLIERVKIKNEIFIEFGVGNYRESNTRFLLKNNNWRGVVFDSSNGAIEKIRKGSDFWKFDLLAQHVWVTVENINTVIGETGLEGEIGLLHIDVDGNDYWIWKAVTVVRPTIVIVEYNSVFGKEKSLTVPYQADFDRTKAHYSNLYFGASLPALVRLAIEKGYTFVGSNSAGNNAYFIRDDRMNESLMRLAGSARWVESRFRESRDQDGRLTWLRGVDRRALLEGLEVVNLETGIVENL